MLTSRPGDLPDFESPPVVETVLSVQFEPLTELRTAHLGLLWEKFRARFPKVEDRPPLDPVVERFPEAPRAKLGLRLQTLETPPVPRMWFVTDRGNEMIQVQPDRFIKNWRKEGQGEEYPHYETGRQRFEQDFDTFLRFLTENRLGTPCVNQCEVTYVNHILAGEGWDGFGDFEKVFSFFRPPAGDIPGEVEDVRTHLRFTISGPGGEPIGRLHADIQPAYRTADNRPMYVFHLTARGQVGDSVEFFEIGRRWIVKSFAALTAPRMHALWKRKERDEDV